MGHGIAELDPVSVRIEILNSMKDSAECYSRTFSIVFLERHDYAFSQGNDARLALGQTLSVEVFGSGLLVIINIRVRAPYLLNRVSH